MWKAVAGHAFAAAVLFCQTPAATLTPDEKEIFLANAQIVKVSAAKKGIANTLRATLTDGKITHDASIAKIDQQATRYETPRGVELHFRDCYKFNIAAWRLARMLGLSHMVPPSVARRHGGSDAAFTWWVEDVQMDETDRRKRKIEAPNKDLWSREYLIMKVFDQLIYNTDRNQQNILYDKSWHLWMIDHTRAFRIHHTLMNEKDLERCDIRLLSALKGLTEPDLTRELGTWLRGIEIKAMLTRRDRIVSHFDKRPDRLYEFLAGPVMMR